MAAPTAERVKANEMSEEDRGSNLPNAMLSHLHETIRNAPPDSARVPADLAPVLNTHKYVFRTVVGNDVGARNYSFRIPVNRGFFQGQSTEVEAFMEKKYRARTTEAQRKKLDDLVTRVGSVWIKFTPAHRKFESFYATNDRVVAAYIREQIKSGAMTGVYEDPGTILLACEFCVRAGTEPPARFPNTEAGQREMVIHIRSEHPTYDEDA